MRFMVLLLGVVGCLLTAVFAGFFAWSQPFEHILHEFGIKELDDLFLSFSLDRVPPIVTGGFLLVSAAFGFLGTLLGFLRCGWQGGLLLLVPVIGPAVLFPITLLGTGLQLLSGVLCMFIRAEPTMVPSDEAGDED